MNEYQINFIEILRLHTKNTEYFMELRLRQGTEDRIRTIKISEDMHQTLGKLVTDRTNGTRFRLSRQFDRLEDSGQWIGSISVTRLDSSHKIPFPCTESFVKEVFLAYEKAKKTKFSPSTIRESLSTEENKKKRSIFLKRTGFLVLAFIALVSFANISTDTLAETSSYQNQMEEPADEPEYGTSDFPDVRDNQNEFYTKMNGRKLQDEESARINGLVALPQPESVAPFYSLESPITRELPKDMVALSFDDGPSDYTKRIADILYEYDAGATFFFIGENIPERGYPVRYITQLGFSIGNHSYAHPYFRTLGKDMQLLEIQKTNELIIDLTGEKPTLFRPPYGAINKTTYDLLSTIDMKVVLWNKDSEDWKANTSQDLVRYAKQNVTGGSIVLFHEKEITVKALPEIIEYLQEQGLKLVSLR